MFCTDRQGKSSFPGIMARMKLRRWLTRRYSGTGWLDLNVGFGVIMKDIYIFFFPRLMAKKTGAQRLATGCGRRTRSLVC